MSCAICRSRLSKTPAVMAMVSAMKRTLRTAMPTRRGVNGTGGDLGERFGAQAAEMLGAVEHRSERTPPGVPAPWLRGGDEERRPQRGRSAAWAPKIRRGSPPGPLPLATAAEDRGAAGDTRGAQRPPAREARLTGAAVHEELLLLDAGLAPRVAVRVHGAAAVLDRDQQRLSQRFVEPARGLLAHGVRQPSGPEPRSMQRLVGVDVAHAGDRLLVEQHCLQRRAPALQLPVQLLGLELHVDRLRPKARHLLRRQQRLLRADQQAAETARVAIAQLPTVIEKENRVRVLLERRDLVDQAQLPGHAEMHDQQHVLLLPIHGEAAFSSPFMGRYRQSRRRGRAGGAGAKPNQNVFAPPRDGFDAHPDHRVDELLRLGMAHDGPKAQLAARDGPADEVRAQVGDDRLYFWKLRHSSDSPD